MLFLQSLSSSIPLHCHTLLSSRSICLHFHTHCCPQRPFLCLFSCVSALVLAFILWNTHHWKTKRAILFFLRTLPESDFRVAREGQLVKITRETCKAALNRDSPARGSAGKRKGRCGFVPRQKGVSGDVDLVCSVQRPRGERRHWEDNGTTQEKVADNRDAVVGRRWVDGPIAVEGEGASQVHFE